MVNVTIDGINLSVPEGTTVLEAAHSIGIKIPTLCFLKEINEIAACRICVVEVEGFDKLIAACNSVLEDGMVIYTDSKSVRKSRMDNLRFILSEHNSDCTVCTRNMNCVLQGLARDMNIHSLPFPKKIPKQKGDPNFPLIRDYTKCIKCMRCIQVCEKIQNCDIWDVMNTSSRTTVDVSGAKTLEESGCTLCGQCITHCPVGALHARDDTYKLLEAIDDPEKIVVAQVAPAIRTSWGEAFGLTPEYATIGRICAAMKRIGFDYVFDTTFSADLTIMEEASEFISRLRDPEHSKFPMFTSCCPGWIRYIKSRYPEYNSYLSTAKSPQQMFGAIAKSWYAELLDVNPANIYCVSIMPCVAKKAEAEIPVMNDACGDPDVDLSLTTREFCQLIRMMNVDPAKLEERELDSPLGVGSGAGNIFGATGGVMEAALRTAYNMVTGENPDPDAFRDVRGPKGWKELRFTMGGKELKVAVINGLSNAHKMLDLLKQGQADYDFVEVMACPGGCVGGGGQPIHDGQELYAERGEVLHAIDQHMDLRFSHENPSIQECYKTFLGEPLSEKAEHLLHTDHFAWSMPDIF